MEGKRVLVKEFIALVVGYQLPERERSVFRAPNKMSVAPRMSGFISGKEGEAGHPRMVDGA